MTSAVACEYSRAVPREWPGLLEVAQSCLAAENQPTAEAVTTMFTQLEPIGDENLELNRYYGLGLAMCKFAQVLKPQQVRTRLIANAAGALSIRALERMENNEADVHLSEHLTERVFQQPFWSLCQQAADDLPPAEHLLVDALAAGGEKRVTAHMFEEHTELDSSYIFKSVESGTATASVLSINVLGGASLIARHVIEKMSQERARHNGSSASHVLRPRLVNFFSWSMIRSLDLPLTLKLP